MYAENQNSIIKDTNDLMLVLLSRLPAQKEPSS